jgi:ABC-type transport system involved in multi-copper enzyme maturation permease subunit
MEVFLFDLLRTTRRGRLVLVRGGYALALLAAIGNVFVDWFGWSQLALGQWFTPGPAVSPRELARFAADFTAAYLVAQLAAVLVLTPAYAAGAVAEERQRRTLDDLLVSGLSGRAIVVGKLAARWLHTFSALLAGLPVLALLQWWGGVDLPLLLAGFTITTLAALSLTALSLLCSVCAQTVPGAVTLTYFVTTLFCTATCCIPFVQCANPIIAVAELVGKRVVMCGAPEGSSILVPYAALHLLLTDLLVSHAARRVRGGDKGPGAVKLPLDLLDDRMRQSGREPFVPPRPPHDPVPEPPALGRIFPVSSVGDDPLLWKERHFGGGTEHWEFIRLLGIGLSCYSLFIGTGLLIDFREGVRSFEDTRQWSLTLLGILTLSVMSLLTVGAGLRAAGGVSRERERGTLDGLLTLPGGRADVLRAKWRGCLDWCRWPALGLAVVCAIGVLTFGLPHAIPLLLMLAGVAHIGFAVSAGLYLSVTARGTATAVFGTVTVLVAACGLPWVAWSLWDGLATPAQQQAVPWLGPLLWDGLLPPVTWWTLAGRSEPTASVSDYVVIVAGLALYAWAAGLFWWRAVARFEREGQGGPRA